MIQEPVLMQFQEGAFNCDKFIAKEILNLKKRFKLKTFIETGTCLGHTTKWAADIFENVHTVEINQEYREFALKRLSGYKNVHSYLGNSADVLKRILVVSENDCLVFLDAHWSDVYCPLEDELNAIHLSRLTPVIAIHDFVVPYDTRFGFDYYKGQAFTFEWLKPYFDKIYGNDNYDYYYNTELDEQSAKRGIIYVTPKV